MTQMSKIIDLKKTYIPGDPNAFPENLVYNGGEDQPAEVNPILAYEGWNFLPTSYGVKSYFGLNGKLDIDALEDKNDWLLLYQKKTLENFLIALGNEGIWIKDTDATGAWTHSITLDPANPGEHLEWTWDVIGEDFYAYRQGGANVYKISPTPVFWIPDDPVPNLNFTIDTADSSATIDAGTYTYYVAYKEDVTGHISIPADGKVVTIATLGDSVDFTWTAPEGDVDIYVMYRKNSFGIVEYQELPDDSLLFTDDGSGWTVDTLPVAGSYQYVPYAIQTLTPNTLNMEGQLGIFRAGSRLGFWDSENAFSWSSLDNKMDFVPSLKTLANAGQKFDDVIGKVVTVKSSKENFVIYSTKSILLIQRAITEAFIWKSQPITNRAGIAYPREVCKGQVDTEHFAYSSMGLLRISEGQFQIIVTEVTDFLRENKKPVYLDLLQNRYLFLRLIDADYINGKVSFQSELVFPITVTFGDASHVIDDPDAPGCEKYNIITKIPDQVWVYDANVDNWDDLDKTETGYPVGVDVPVYSGETNLYGTTSNSLGSNSEVNLSRIYQEGVKTTQDQSFLDTFPGVAAMPFGTYLTAAISVFSIIQPSKDMSATVNALFPTERKFTYSGDVSLLFATQLQKFFGTAEFFKKYIADRAGKSASNDVGPLIINNVTPLDPSGVDLDLENLNTTAQYAQGAALATRKERFCLLPIELGPVQIEGKTISGKENAVISCTQHITKFGGFILKTTAKRVSSIYIDDGIVDPHYEHTINEFVEYVPFTVNVIPCDSYEILCDDAAAISVIQAMITDMGGLSSLHDKVFRCRIYISDFIIYSLDGSHVSSGTTNPDVNPGDVPAYPNACPTNNEDSTIFGTIFGGFNTSTGTICGTAPDPSGPIFDQTFTVTAPAGSFLIQSGSPAPLYPTFKGALVYDNQLKRWGKFKGDFKELLDYAPINNISSGIVPYDVFGVEGAALLADGKIATFDEAPDDSLLKYGKIGYARAGFTDGEEIIAHFRRGSTGSLGHVASLDGRTEEATIASETAFEDEVIVTHYVKDSTNSFGISAKWISIVIKGLFDLQYLEFKGHRKSRR